MYIYIYCVLQLNINIIYIHITCPKMITWSYLKIHRERTGDSFGNQFNIEVLCFLFLGVDLNLYIFVSFRGYGGVNSGKHTC